MTHTLEGRFATAGGAPFLAYIGAEVDLDLPDIVTLSIRQAIAPNMRLLGTIEWSNWSEFQDLTLVSTAPGTVAGAGAVPAGVPFAAIDANWSDGWFFSIGGEYDYNDMITLRAGAAYEISPVDNPTKRFTSIPDNDRVWLSAGATVKVSHNIALDLAYTHVFIEDGDFLRTSLGGNVIGGYSEAQVDIFAASLKTTWGAKPVLEPMK